MKEYKLAFKRQRSRFKKQYRATVKQATRATIALGREAARAAMAVSGADHAAKGAQAPGQKRKRAAASAEVAAAARVAAAAESSRGSSGRKKMKKGQGKVRKRAAVGVDGMR